MFIEVAFNVSVNDKLTGLRTDNTAVFFKASISLI